MIIKKIIIIIIIKYVCDRLSRLHFPLVSFLFLPLCYDDFYHISVGRHRPQGNKRRGIK